MKIDIVYIIAAVVIMGAFAVLTYGISHEIGYEQDYGTGSVVTTTHEYNCMTNDSFTGVVVCGRTGHDSACTVRAEDGTYHRIATKYLEPLD